MNIEAKAPRAKSTIDEVRVFTLTATDEAERKFLSDLLIAINYPVTARRRKRRSAVVCAKELVRIFTREEM